LTFWKTGGSIQIQNKKILIPRTFSLPEQVQIGSWVLYKTEEKKGREILTGITPVENEDRSVAMASQVQGLDRGTIFTLNAIPLGGFVRMSGEDDPTAPNAFASKPAWQRAIILVAGVTMNFILAFLVFMVLAVWVPQTAVAATTTIVGVLPNTPAAQADLRVNDTVIVGMNAEAFFETGLAIKAQSPLPDTFVLGYTNGTLGYLPRAQDYPPAGWKLHQNYAVPDLIFQVHPQPVALRPDSEQRAVEGAVQLIRQLAGSPSAIRNS